MAVLQAVPRWTALLLIILPFLAFAQNPPSPVDLIDPNFIDIPWVNRTGGYIRIPYNYNAAFTSKIVSQLPYPPPAGNISSFRLRPRPDVNWNEALRDIPYVGLQMPLTAAEHLAEANQQRMARRDAVPQTRLAPTTALAPPGPFNAILAGVETVVSDTYDRCAMDKAVWETATDQLRTADNFFLHSDDWLELNGRRFDVQGRAKVLLDDAAQECVGVARAAADAYLHSPPGQRQKRRLIKRQGASQSSLDYVSMKLDAMAEEMINEMFLVMAPANEKIVELIAFKAVQASAVYEAKQRSALANIKGLELRRANMTYTIQDEVVYNQTQAYRNQVAVEFTNELMRISTEERSSFDSPITRVLAADFQVSNTTQTVAPPLPPQLQRRADLPNGFPPADLPLAAPLAASAPPAVAPPNGAPLPAFPHDAVAPAAIPPSDGAPPPAPRTNPIASTTGDVVEDSRRSQVERNAFDAGELAADRNTGIRHGTVKERISAIADTRPYQNTRPAPANIMPLHQLTPEQVARQERGRAEGIQRGRANLARLKANMNANERKGYQALKQRYNLPNLGSSVPSTPNVDNPPSNGPPINGNPPDPGIPPVDYDNTDSSNNLPEMQSAREAEFKANLPEAVQRQRDAIESRPQSPEQKQEALRDLESQAERAPGLYDDAAARQVGIEGRFASGNGEAGLSDDVPRSRPQTSFQDLSTQFREAEAALGPAQDGARIARGKARIVEEEIAHEQLQWEAGERQVSKLKEDVRAAKHRGDDTTELQRLLAAAEERLSEHQADRGARGQEATVAEDAIASAEEEVVEATQRFRQTSDDLVQAAGTPEELASAHQQIGDALEGGFRRQSEASDWIEEHNVLPREDVDEVLSRVDSVIDQPVEEGAGSVVPAEASEGLSQQIQAFEEQARKRLADSNAVKGSATEDLSAIVDANAKVNAKMDGLLSRSEELLANARQQLQANPSSPDLQAEVAADESKADQFRELRRSTSTQQLKLADNSEALPEAFNDLIETQARQQAKIESLNQKLDSRKAKLVRKQEKAKAYKANAQDLKAHAEKTQAALEIQEDRVIQLEWELEQAQSANTEAAEQEGELREKIAQTNQELEKIKAGHGETVESQRHQYRTQLNELQEQLRASTTNAEEERNAAWAHRGELQQARADLAEAQEAREASKASHAEDALRLENENALLKEQLGVLGDKIEVMRAEQAYGTTAVQAEQVALEIEARSAASEGVVGITEAPSNSLLMDMRISNSIPVYTGNFDDAPHSMPGSPDLAGNAPPGVTGSDPLPGSPDDPVLTEPGRPAELPPDWPPEVPNPERAPVAPSTRPPPAVPATTDLSAASTDLQQGLQQLKGEAQAFIEYAGRENLPQIVETTQAALNEIDAELEEAQTLTTEIAAGPAIEPAVIGAAQEALAVNEAVLLTRDERLAEAMPAVLDDTMHGALWNPARVNLRSNEARLRIEQLSALERQVNERLALEKLSPADRAALLAQTQEIQRGLADLRVSEAASQAANAAADASLITTVGSLARLETRIWNRISMLRQLSNLKAAGTTFRASLWESISALKAAGAGAEGADAALAEELATKQGLFSDLIKASKQKYGTIEKELSSIFKALDKSEEASAEVVEATTRYRATIEALTGVASRASQAVEASPRAAVGVAEGIRALRSGLTAAGTAVRASAAAKVNSLVRGGRYAVTFARDAYEAIRTGTAATRVAAAAADASSLMRAGGAISSLMDVEVAYFTGGEVATSETIVLPFVLAAIEAVVIGITACLEPILHAIMDPREKDSFKDFWVDLNGDNILEKIGKWQAHFDPHNSLLSQYVPEIEHYYETTKFSFSDAEPHGGLGDVTVRWKGDAAGNMAEGYALVAILKNKALGVEEKAFQLFETLHIRNKMDNHLKSFVKIWADFDYNGKPGLTKIKLDDEGGGLGKMTLTGNLWRETSGTWRDKIVVRDSRQLLEACQDCVDDDD